MENRGKIIMILIRSAYFWFLSHVKQICMLKSNHQTINRDTNPFIIFIVTVYTQFGYAQMDVDKYKDDFNP